MADTEYLDVMDGSSASAEYEDVSLDTAGDDSVVDPSSEDQSIGDEGNIRDANATADKTVPYDRFNEVNSENKLLRERLDQITTLMLQNQSRTQPQATSAPKIETDDEIIARIVGDESFITPQMMSQIAKEQRSRDAMVREYETINSRGNAITAAEVNFKAVNADYDVVIANIPPAMVNALMSAYPDPNALVAAAYSYGKSLAGTPKPAVKDLIPPAGKVPAKPVPTLSTIKGGQSTSNMSDEQFRTWFNQI